VFGLRELSPLAREKKEKSDEGEGRRCSVLSRKREAGSGLP
jgi:hypothetical protein